VTPVEQGKIKFMEYEYSIANDAIAVFVYSSLPNKEEFHECRGGNQL